MSGDATTVTCCNSGLATFSRLSRFSDKTPLFTRKPLLASELLAPVSMPSDLEVHRGYAVYWYTSSSADDAWNARGVILSPPDSSGLRNRLTGVTGHRFTSESEARDFVIREAKKWIDEILMRRTGTTALKFILTVISVSAAISYSVANIQVTNLFN